MSLAYHVSNGHTKTHNVERWRYYKARTNYSTSCYDVMKEEHVSWSLKVGSRLDGEVDGCDGVYTPLQPGLVLGG